LFLIRISALIFLFKTSRKYSWKNYQVAESEKAHGSFSFFHFIFLGRASELNDQEKEEVLIHEEVHVQQYHSFDIILTNILGIVFWFNPVVLLYRNSLVQIHEFEADARSVEGRDVNAYCSLLAKVALQSNGYVLANHFTNSLTLKRIHMMKTVRKKIKQWKVATAIIAVLLIFFVVACQDQVMQDIQTITDNSTAATMLPANVEAELIKL
jgi:beta-lactamase regulating signal transducer with metallopeptidase domain